MRKLILVALLAGLVGGLVGLSIVPVALWAQGGGCWGSICQSAQGVVILSKSVTPNQPISLSTSPFGFLQLGDLGLHKQTLKGLAPGPQVLVLRARPSVKRPGACMLVGAAGTSAIETVIADPIGGQC